MSKALWFIFMLAFSTLVSAVEPVSSLKGEVLEVKDVESYTYLRLKTNQGETWAAVGRSPVKTGSQVTIDNAMVMTNFESKSLKKVFPTIVFGSLSGASAVGHPASVKVALDASPVAKAVGINARTVFEVVTHATELKDKPVLVRGRVVKYNPGIMGKNWLHLRDGSGTEENNDILVTSLESAKVGDIITVKGVVRNDKDFGAGYAYKVLIEEAKLIK